MSVHGDGPLVRNPGTDAAATWRGIILIKDDFDSWQTLAAGGDFAAVTYDRVPFDTDNFMSVAPITEGLVTIPSGSSAVIPAGLGGLYRVSSQIAVGIEPDAGGYAFQTRIQQNGSVTDDFPQNASSTSIYGFGLGIDISPGLFVCEEGDVIWQFMQNDSAAADAVIITRSWLLVEYLMPWEIDDT